MSNERNQRIEEMFANMRAMKRLMVCYMRSDDKELLPPSQGELLLIAHQEQPIVLKQLAEHMRLTPGAVSQLVESLERLGLIKREPSVVDRRTVHVVVTPKGEDKIAAIKQQHTAVFKHMTEALSDSELDAMVTIQHKMINHLKESYDAFNTKKEDA